VAAIVLAACSDAQDCTGKDKEAAAAYDGAGRLSVESVEASHYVMLDRPEETARFVLAALDGHRQQTGEGE
jgi:hypothetical protein